MGRIVKPGEVEFRQVSKSGPLAEPCVVRMETPGVIQFVTLGGLTKVEALAGQIGAGFLASNGRVSLKDGEEYIRETNSHHPDARFERMIASRSVNIAEAILAECQRRAKEKQEASQQSR